MKNNFFRKWLVLSALLAFMCFLPHGLLRAQNIANYSFSTSTSGTLEDLSTGATSIMTAAVHDDDATTVNPIGFNFTFMGVSYSHFSTNSNGQFLFHTSGTATAIAGGSTTPSAGTPLLFPMSGDNELAGGIRYKVIGSAPNRKFVLEWTQFYVYFTNITNAGNMQLWLNETTGRIDFIYGAIYNSRNATVSPSIGISAGTTATTQGSVTVGTTPTYSASATLTTNTFAAGSGTATGSPLIANLGTAVEGTRRVYSFTPASTIAPTTLSFAAVAATSMTLNWTDNATNEAGYRVYRSLDGITYTLAATLPTNTNTYNATGLNINTLYYWKVVAYGEIGESTPDLLGSQSTTPASFAGGIKTVGSGGDYQNLTTAFAAINAQGLTGNVELQLITGYPAAPETYPILSCNNIATGAFTVKVYPTVSGLSITSANTTGTLNLNGATNVTFDGRVNQTGAADLVISNTNAGASYAVQFVNDAKNNTLQYLTIHSANNSTSSGTIVFAGSTGTTGNDNNLIDRCDIKDGATTPLNGIYSAGTSTTLDNSGNTVSNSNIFNYFGAATASNGVLLASNSSAWTINANKFYQTATRTLTGSSQHRGINIITSSGNGYVITNNVIGYASSTGTGVTTYTASAGRFFGIELTAATTGTASSIQGNTVTAISLTTTSGTTAEPGIFSGISVLGGSVSIGNVTPNVIGANSGTGAVTVSTSNNANVFGIHANSTGTLMIANNIVGAINAAGNAAGVSCGIVGINTVGASTATSITGNTIGSTTANSIASGTSGITTATTTVAGIATASAVTTLTVTGNTVNNITNYSSGTSSVLRGIFSANAPVTAVVSNNTMSNLALTAGTLTGLSIATPGTATANGNTISNATVTAASGVINGISSTSGTTLSYTKNKIYNLNASGTGSSVNGMLISGGTTVGINNNLIGDLKTPQTSAANPLNGINITGGTTVNVYYNTVNLNGTSAGTNFGSSAISVATGTTVDFQNNIFHNASVSNGTGLSVSYRRSSTTLTSYAAASNRNDFVAAVLFHDGTNSDATLAAYQTRVGARDANSISQAPNYLNTTGSSVDFLHINPAIASPLESAGANIAGLTTDFDGNIRQGNAGYAGTGTAPDMGADEFELSVTNCSTVAGGTISPASASICPGATRTMTVTGATNLAGISYQWKSSTTPGGPYTNVSGGTGATTDSYTTGAMTAGTYYFVMETTCSFGPTSGLSNEFTLTVNPTPVVVVTPSSGTYCFPGGTAVALAATGATTYAWTPATGLSATNVANVNASPSATTTYSVVGTALGCASAPTPVTITVAPMPVMASVTATPAAVCEGSNSQLLATATVSYNSGPSAYTFAGSTGTYTPITGTTLGASSLGDDVGIGNLPIGFTFPYNGTTFTVFGARSNGLIELGQTSATLTGLSSNSLSGNSNCIAPLWDDNNTEGGSIIYSTTGTAPNRVLTVQWTAMHVGGAGSNTSPKIDCQLQLFETTGVIKYIYGTSEAFTSTASIGISGAIGNYLSVTPLSPANTSTVSSSTENTGISAATNFPSGTIYTFTPPAVPTLTYAWTPSTNLSATNIANPVATGVTTPITYNVVATAASGCSVNGNVSLTIKPLPTAPTGANSAQCGTQIPTASVTSTTGAPTPTFVWYDALVGGNLVQSSTSATLTSNVSTTTTFGVAELSATGCESPRTAVTVTVATADVISATASSTSICIGSSINLNTANLNPTPLQNYTYSWASTTGSGMETPVSGAAQTVTPTALGTYTYTVTGTDGGCGASASVTVSVNAYPIISSAIATPATVCSSDPIALTAASITTSAGTTPIGTQTTTDFGSGVYRYGFGTGDFRHQLLFTAAELNAAGLQAGNITSLAFNVTSVGSGTGNNYTIKMGNTSATALTATFLTDPTSTVYTNAGYTAVNGLNTHTFSTPFNWNGTSNVLIEICYNVSVAGGSSTLAVNTPSATRNVSLLGTANACTAATGTTQTLRPIVTFGGQIGTNHAASYNWSWTPGTGLNTAVATTSVSNTSGSPVSQAFTAIATDPVSGCATTLVTSPITINSAPPAPVATNSTQCGTMTPTASVTGTGTPGNTFSWYTVSTGGTAISGQTGSSLSAFPVSATTTFYVSENNGTCSSVRTPVTVTVTPAPAISIAGTTTICNGSSTSLTASSPNDPNYTYTWSGGLGTGATVAASPTTNTTYTVTATDASGGVNNGCITTATTSITVNPLPLSFPITPATATICNGAVQQLTVPVTAGGTAILGTGTTAPGTTSFPNPLSAYYGGTKHQILFTAAELTAQGMSAGSKINSVAFDLNAFAANACTNFTIRMGNTALTALTGFVGGTTTVYGPTTFTPSATGLVTFTLVSPYTWDGTSNIVIETVHNAGNGGNGSGTRTNTTTTATNTVYYGSTDNVAGGIAGYDALTTWGTSGASNLRPNMRFVYTNIQPTWSPAGSLYTNSGATTSYVGGSLAGSVYAKPTATTTYIATYTGANGCTAQRVATITVNQPTSSSVSATACDTYTWAQNGATYTTSGTHTAVIPNAAGCDSTITLNLTIKNSTSATVAQTACDTYTWPINGQTYVASGTHTATIPNAAGCDSVITLNLTINHSTTATVNQTACQTYTWPLSGQTYTVSGTHTATLTNAAGCDSVVTLNLTIGGPSAMLVPMTACGSYTWPQTGLTYNASGAYNDTVPNMYGCDSVITLSLTINQPTTATVIETECTSYTWAQNGMTYTTSGMYNDTIPNAAGCDSVITLDLTIIQPTTSSVSATACTSYTWAQNGMTYTASGMYNDTIPNAAGCDSIITLNLTINNATASTVTVSTCNPTYTWAQNGTVYTATGMYNDTITNAAGCDSVVTLNLTIAPFAATATDNGNATITASAGTTYQWINCATNAPIAGATTQTFTATANGTYAAVVSNGTCSDTTNCVNITNVGIKEQTISTISVHPNPTHDFVIVTMDDASAVVEVMDVQGKLVQTTQIKSGDQIDLGAYERGVYTLRIKTESGTSIERIVKN